MQITTLDRKEWWTDLKPTNEHDHYIEQYGEHHTFKFKWGSHIDNPHGLLRKASKINYNFIDERWERDDFLRQHAQFTAWCHAQGAEMLCVASETYIDCAPPESVNITDILAQHHLPADEWHLNNQGHTLVADRVREHIKKNYPHWL